MSSFQGLGFFDHNNPETEAQRSYAQHALPLSCHLTLQTRNSFGSLPQGGYCKRKTPKS